MFRNPLFFILTISLFLLALGTERSEAQSAPGVEILLTSDAEQLVLGQPITFTLEVKHPAGNQVIIPELSRAWGDLEVRDQSVSTTVANEDGTETTSQTIEATSYSLGELITPELAITVVDPSGEIARQMTPIVTLTTIPTLAVGDDALVDLRPQASLPRQPIWPLILAGTLGGVLVIGLLGWGVYLLLKRMYWLPGMTKPFVDTRSAYEIVRDDLAQLDTLDLPAQGLYKEHYAKVSESVRQYLGDVYNVPVSTLTINELDAALADSVMRTDDCSRVISFLKGCDMAKYAHVDMQADSVRQSTQRARDLIELITPVASWTGRGA